MKIEIQDVPCEGRHKAQCPALPGCVAYGASPEEARQKLHGLIEGYLASLNLPAQAVQESLPDRSK